MKAFKITSNNQFLQDIKLRAGEYTFHAWVLAENSTYKFALQTASGWQEFDLSDQIILNNWVKVRLTFTIYEQATRFSLMSDGAGYPVTCHVLAPQLEEGSNAGTHKPNELDLEEMAKKANTDVKLGTPFYDFKATSDGKGIPTSITIPIYAMQDGVLLNSLNISIPNSPPTGMSVQAGSNSITVGVNSNFVSISGSVRINVTIDGVVYPLDFTYTLSKSGQNAVMYTLYPSLQTIKKNSDGTAEEANISCKIKKVDGEQTTILSALPAGYSMYRIVDDGSYFTYTIGSNISTSTINNKIRFDLLDDIALKTIDQTTIYVHKDGRSPYIDSETGTWWVWDDSIGDYRDTNDPAHGDDGHSPRIGVNGTWEVWENGDWYDTGIKAKGEDGAGIAIKGSVNNYAELSQLTGLTAGDAYLNKADGLLYIWDGYSFPANGQGIEFKGDPGENAKWIKLTANSTQIKAKETPIPATVTVIAQLFNMTGNVVWSWSVDGGAFSSSNRPAYLTISNNVATINSSTADFEVLALKATKDGQEDVIAITRVGDGERGLPGKSPVTAEYRNGATYYNTDEAVNYVYYRAGNSWWKLKDDYEQYTTNSASPNPTYFEPLSSVEVWIAEVIIAERANLAEWIFSEGVLMSQRGKDSNGNDITFGDHLDMYFARNNSTSTQPTIWESKTPPTSGGTYLWMRYRTVSENGNSAYTVVRIGSTVTAQYSALGDSWSGTYINGYNWIKLNGGGFNNEIYKLNPIETGFDFNPNAYLDGKTGRIVVNDAVFRGSIAIKPVVVDNSNIDNYLEADADDEYLIKISERTGFNFIFRSMTFDAPLQINLPTINAEHLIGTEVTIINYLNQSSRAMHIKAHDGTWLDWIILNNKSFVRLLCVPLGAIVQWVKIAGSSYA